MVSDTFWNAIWLGLIQIYTINIERHKSEMDDKYTDLAVHLQEVDSRSKSNEHRIDDLESDMKETKDMQITLVKLANGVENMGTQLMDVKQDIQEVKKGQDELSDKVTTLENKPAQEEKKKRDKIVFEVVKYVIIGIIGFLLAQLAPGVF